MDAKEQARKWLIENNHHACHLLVDQQDGQRQDGTMPRPEDVESLAELLRGARAQRMTAGMDDQSAVATCRDCGATGVEMGFEHYCVPLAAYQDRRRIVEYMRARCSNVSHFANLTLLADDIENMPYETRYVSSEHNGTARAAAHPRPADDGWDGRPGGRCDVP